MHLCLFEDENFAHLLPLVHTRAVYDLRLGIRTLLETTREAFGTPGTLLHCRKALAAVTGQENGLVVNRIPDGIGVLFVNGRYIAEDGPVLERLQAAGRDGEPGRVFTQGDEVVAAWVPDASSRYVQEDVLSRSTFDGLSEEKVDGARLIGRVWHLIDELRPAIARDYEARTKGYNILDRPGAEIQDGVLMTAPERIYVAPGAVIRAGAILNAENGPIYIDREATVREGAALHGPIYMGTYSEVKVFADVEAGAFGTYSKVNGEVHDSILHSYSSKAHAGFLGHSYLGRWCNLGADTNNSDLKNDYGIVSMYNPAIGDFEKTGRQFLGLIMGDHSKCGINTMFNTGTVLGVFVNLYGAGFPPRHLPSFSWGSPDTGFTEYRIDKAFHVAEAVMARRKTPFTDADRDLLTHVFEATRTEREAPVVQ